MTHQPRFPSFGCAFALALLFQAPLPIPAAETTAEVPAPEAAPRTIRIPSPEPVEGLALKIAMTSRQVRELVGEPREIQPMKTAEGLAEVWIYIREVGQTTRMVATSMKEVPWVDPITGEMRMLQEPVYSQEIETLRAELHLLMFNGRLLNWKLKPLKPDRRYF